MVMFAKLKVLFPNAVIFDVPQAESLAGFYVFYDPAANEWMGIPKTDLGEKELAILQALYELYEPEQPVSSPKSKAWYEFLFQRGKMPADEDGALIRFIQFHITGIVERPEFESALKGFFTEKVVIIWENGSNATVIEKGKHRELSLSERELTSMVETLENDFFIKVRIYFGRQYPFTDQLPACFQEEKEYFASGRDLLEEDKIFTFERIFPSYLVFHLPGWLKEKFSGPLGASFLEDPETYTTLKVFLENNLNASLAAKKLYIHRNTLQYRIDKFTENSGIHLKDFYGAVTVFLACLMVEQNHNNLPKKE